jgi:hypothetical protein
MRMLSIFVLFSLFLSSCAGYNFRLQSNPFSSQGIRSVAIPMFINKTSLPHVTAAYTKSVHDVLSSYPDLKVNAGDIENEDAVVLGIISSKRELNKEIEYTSSTLMSDEQIDEIGDRNAFYVPTVGEYDLKVQIVILKRPTKEEIDFFVNYFKFSKTSFPRTVFSKEFAINGTYSINNDVGGANTSAPLRGTITRGNLVKSLSDSSNTFADELREVLANAY